MKLMLLFDISERFRYQLRKRWKDMQTLHNVINTHSLCHCICNFLKQNWGLWSDNVKAQDPPGLFFDYRFGKPCILLHGIAYDNISVTSLAYQYGLMFLCLPLSQTYRRNLGMGVNRVGND